MKNFSIKRFTASLLFIVMVVAALPTSLFNFTISTSAAGGTPTIVIAGSDYQNTNGGLFSSGASTDAYAIMSAIKRDYASAYGFLFGGDYYAHNTNTTTESTNGKNQLKGEIVDVLYPDMADETQIYIQGNHDADSLTTNGTLATSGAHDTDYYGVYVINEKDYMWYNDNQSTIKNTASALKSYLDEKTDEGYNKPIFVLSHLPLHYSNRTIKEGDGKYAKYIYDVLDEAGKNDLNIIFMYGHNHSTSYYEEYLGNAAVYLAEGDTIYVANEGSQSSCFSDTLSFTYMNYGFTGYLTGTAADGALTMTVFEIYEDEVIVKRYDENGVHNLKSAGTNGSTPSGATYNTTVYTSPQTIELTTPEAKATFTNNGVTVTAAGITGVTASKAESPTYNSSLYSGYEEYTVSATGYETGKNATVEFALTDGDFDTTRSVTVKFPDGHTEEVAIVNGTVTVDTDVLGTFTLMQKVQTTIEIPGDSSSEDTGDGTIWRQVTTMTAGKKYMLVNYGDNASGVGTYAINSTAGGTTVTVLTDSTGAYIENSDMALAWNYNSNAELTNVSTGQYLYIASFPSGTSGVAVAVTNSVTTGTSYSSWKLATNTGVNEVSLSAYRNGSHNYYPARWSNGGKEYLAYTSTQTSKYDNWIAIFEQTSEGGSSGDTDYPTVDTDGGDWVTIINPSGGTNGLYGKIEGDLEYTVPYGTSEAVALQKVKDGITIKWATASDYSDEATFDDNGTGMSWEVVDYDPETPGEYAVNIYYTPDNGEKTLLGTAKIIVNEKPAGTAQVTIDSDSGIVRQNAGAAALTGNKLTITYEDGTTETVNVTVGMVKNADGTVVDTSVPGTYSGLKVVYTYNGVEYTIIDNYTLTVRENVQNNYPEYPDEGAVKVNKTAIYTDEKFRETGVAQVELSVSGIPSKKGVDVIVMVDTSSSMKRGAGTNKEVSAPNRRIDFLQVALANLIKEFQGVGDDGEQLDINVAIAEFNGYEFISGEDEPSDSAQQGASNVAEVFTGDGSKTAGAFVQANTITNPETWVTQIGEHSGTNYDYAFDTIYRLGAAITAQNEANKEDRDLFVIFMSDGAPYGFNYYGSGTTDTWDDYLNGNMTLNTIGRIVDDTGVYLKGNTHFYRTDGNHWMAEAVKGNPDEAYMVIDPTDSLGTDATAADVKAYEDAGIILTEGETSYFRMVPGLGAEVHTIGFCLYDDDQSNGNIVYATTQKALMQRLASTDAQGNLLYHETDSGADLNETFCTIASQIAYAANNARFVDQMGDAFDLQTSSSVTRTFDGVEKNLEFSPAIIVKQYTIYTRQDYIDGLCTEEQIGERKNVDPTILETVAFSENGKKAYSDKIDVDGDGVYGFDTTTDANGYTRYTPKDPDGDNILAADGMIYAKTFVYNTSTDSTLTIEGTAITVEPETFYWKVGTVTTSELAISYYVYLTDTMEGEREAGSYATNNFAVLYYDNYLGNECKIETVSPMLAWKEANVSYAFYLVDTDGNVIVNRATGQTGTFANKIAITNPVIFATCKLNTENEVPALSVSETDLPSEYEIYDPSALYKVVILSYQDENAATVDAGWTITTGKTAHTTYVTGYSTTEPYSNALTQNGNYDYTHTTVWFAVVWEPGTIADQVVIDYGLPVDISVLENDLFASGATLNGIGTTANKPTMADGHNYAGEASTNFYTTEQTFQFGKAIVNGDKVRYTPTSTAMTTYDKFAYEVKFDYNGTNQFYYGDVTVIPATIIYYEETFVDFENGYTVTVQADGTTNKDTAPQVADSKQVSDGTEAYGDWVKVGTEIIDATQAEDRPGQYSLSYIDANNLYGYDGVNSSITKYSLGTAMQVTVGKTYDSGTSGAYTTTGYNGYTPTATFTFTGTGFDIISLTDSDSGMIKVTITGGPNNTTESMMITNYYGMSYQVVSQDENGNDVYGWVSDENGALYQVPVIKKTGLDYGTYTVTIQVGYMTFFDQDNGGSGDGKYYFVLDAIRIYDPSNGGSANGNDTVIEDAYKADGEAYPHYLMVKEAILGKTDLENLSPDKITGTLNGTVFIDGKGATTDAADYANPGPNNEAYLINAQSISFKLTANAVPTDVQLGAKLASGTSATVNVYYGSTTSDPVVINLDSATDMYYSIMENLPHTMTDGSWTTNTIIIEVVADDSTIVSLTNIKATFKSDKVLDENGATTDEDVTLNPVSATASTGTYSLMSARMMNLETTETVTEEPVSISFLVDAEVIEDACAVMTELYAPEPEVFVPEVLEYTVSNGFFGYSTVVILTSKDVESITVNGVEATKISGSRMFNSMLRLFSGLAKELGITSKTTDYYIWTVSTKRAASYDIVAVNADGLASDPTLTDSNTSITKEDVESFFDRERIFEIMEEIANQTFDPEQFEAYVNERFDGMREIITQTSEDVEYVIINGKIVDRYITETVIDTETGETTTKRVWITDADDEAEDEEVEVNVYDRKGVGSESKKAERRFKNNKNNSNNGNSNSASDKNNKENNGKGNSGKYGRM